MLSSLNIWLLIVVSFTTYFLISGMYKKFGVRNLQQGLIVRNGLSLLNLKHLLGIVFFGIFFYVVIPDLRFLIEIIEIPRLPILILFLALTILSAYISYASIKNNRPDATGLNYYNVFDAWSYFFIRFAFLFCYEFFFRGVLLYTFLEFNSPFFAITYSTILYVVIHFFDSKKEIMGTVPFGIILCLFTYITNSIWYAFLMHLSLSAVYEISLFYYQTFKASKS